MKVAFVKTIVMSIWALSALNAQGTESKRIITAGGTITEIVFALNSGDEVVAIDSSSNYPAEALTKPIVGYYRDLAAEGVLSLQPTEMLVLEGAGRKEALTLIKQAGVTVTQFKKPVDIESLFNLIKELGKRLGKPLPAEQLISDIQASLDVLNMTRGKSLNSTNKSLTAVSLLSLSDRGAVVAGLETVPTFLFNSLGITNPVDSHKGFKPVGLESLVLMKPDFLLVPSHVAASMGGKSEICKHPSLSLLTVSQSCHVLVLDSLLSMAITPRIAESLTAIENFTREL